jgi:excisionase family DNA binding protein
MSVELGKLFSRDVLEALDERIRQIAIESQPSPAPPEEFISLKTASRRFDIPVDTLEKWVRAGRLKKYKFGRCVRIRLSDLLREDETGG